MDHLPLRVHYAMTGKNDKAGRLRSQDDIFQQAPNHEYWHSRCNTAAQACANAVYQQTWDAFSDRYPDSWFETQSWMNLAHRYERLRLALDNAGGKLTVDEMCQAFGTAEQLEQAA